MKLITKTYLLAIFFLVVLVAGCRKDDDDPIQPSIVGTWKGTSLYYTFTPSGLGFGVDNTDEEYDATVQFMADGTVTYSDGGTQASGTYEVNNNIITTSVNIPAGIPVTLNTFTIKELTQTKLELTVVENNVSVPVPNVGNVSGTLRATLSFDRQ